MIPKRGVIKHTTEFIDPSWDVLNAFCSMEREQMVHTPPLETIRGFIDLLRLSLHLT